MLQVGPVRLGALYRACFSAQVIVPWQILSASLNSEFGAYFSQFSTRSPGTRKKSRVLAVTTIAPRVRAMAAIFKS